MWLWLEPNYPISNRLCHRVSLASPRCETGKLLVSSQIDTTSGQKKRQTAGPIPQKCLKCSCRTSVALVFLGEPHFRRGSTAWPLGLDSYVPRSFCNCSAALRHTNASSKPSRDGMGGFHTGGKQLLELSWVTFWSLIKSPGIKKLNHRDPKHFRIVWVLCQNHFFRTASELDLENRRRKKTLRKMIQLWAFLSKIRIT